MFCGLFEVGNDVEQIIIAVFPGIDDELVPLTQSTYRILITVGLRLVILYW